MTERQQQELIDDFIEGLGVDDELIDGYNDINALDTVDDNDDQLMNKIVLGLDTAAEAERRTRKACLDAFFQKLVRNTGCF